MKWDVTLGAETIDGWWRISEDLGGEGRRGRYRAQSLVNPGETGLVATTLPQPERSLTEFRQKSLDVHGLAPVVYVGGIDTEGESWSLMIEQEPPGVPSAAMVGAWGIEPALRLARSVGEVVIRAHERGLVLWDLRPELVYVTPETQELTGIAPRCGQFWAQEPPESGEGIGNPFEQWFRAHEFLKGYEPTTASDVFGMAALVCWWATGRWAFEGENPLEMALSMLRQQRRAETFPLPAAIEAALSGNPGERPSAHELVKSMDLYLSELA